MNTFYYKGDIMNIFFENKVVVITGAAQGIGKCIATEFKKLNASKMEYYEPDSVNRVSSSIIMDVTVPKCSFTYKINVKDLKLSKYDILMYSSIYLNSKFGQASLFCEKLKNKGLISETLGFDTDIVGNHLVMTIFGESKNYDELLRLIHEEMEKNSANEKDFNRYKKVLISNLIYSSENIYSINDSITNSVIRYGKYEDRYKLLSKLNIDGYEKFINNLNFDNNSSFVIKNNN